MTACAEGSGPAPPRPPDRIDAIGPQPAGLAIAGPARARRFLLEGAEVTAAGSERGGLDTVRIGPGLVATDVRGASGPVANVVLHPGLVRRERVGSAGTEVETIVTAQTLPLLALQVEATRSSSARTLSLDLHVRDGWARGTGPGSVVVRTLDGSLIAVGAAPAGTRVELVEEGPTGARALVHARAEETTTLLIAAGPEARVRSAFAAAAHLSTHARLAAGGTLDDGLRLVTGVDEIDEGLQWARRRLAAALARAEREGPGSASAASWAGLAALAVGDWSSAERALRLSVTASERAGVDRATAAHLSMLADRAVLSLGAAGPLADLARRLSATAVAATTAAASQAPRRSALTGGRLPMAGPRSADDPAGIELLRALLHGEARSERGHDTGTDARLAPLVAATLARTDADAAWSRWRAHLAAGLDDGPAGAATWDPLDDQRDLVAPGAAALLLGVAHGLLGLGPDAPVGRLRLAPRLPAHLTRLRVEGLSVGPARLALDYEREGRRHRFRIEPERATVPPNLVFEPSVPGPVREVRIDGARADLDLRSEGTRTVAPVQLAVDAPRLIEIEG